MSDSLGWNEMPPDERQSGECVEGADYASGLIGLNYNAAFYNIASEALLVALGTGSPDQGN